MKKFFALASMMIVLSVSAQQPRMDKKGPKPIELKKDKKQHKKNEKIINHKKEVKLALQKKQHHDKKEHLKRQKEIAYHPIKMR